MQKEKIKPLGLTIVILLFDQITKALIVKSIPLHTVGKSFFGDFLRIIHTRNLAVAFSIGNNFPQIVRVILFTIIPFAVLVFLFVYFLRSKDFTPLQRWAVAGILGGGFGNLFDRIFRPMGVIDFIDVKFYGLLGVDRLPTFNVADASFVICGVLLFIAYIAEDRGKNA